MFKIKQDIYSSMFSLPTQIADNTLKFANGEQLKVIISIFRNPSADFDEIKRKTNLSLEDIKECVEFWQDMGIIETENDEIPLKKESEVPEIQQINKPAMEIHFIKPTQEELNDILENNNSLSRLMHEAEMIFGKTIGYGMKCVIYSLVEYYGITPDVANCLLHFAKSIDYVSQRQIQKIADYWFEHDIRNQNDADEYISETTEAISLFYELAEKTNNSTDLPSFSVLSMMYEWIQWGYKFDVIYKAFEIMKAEKETGRIDWNNCRHINGTLKNWRSQGMYTLEDIEKGTKKFETKANKKANKNKETSFDVELAEEMAKKHMTNFGSKKNKRHRKSKEA